MPTDYRQAARERMRRKHTYMPKGRIGQKHKQKYMTKTTKKGAYNPKKKSNFQKRRAPFVETKNQTDEILAAKNGDVSGALKDGIRNPTVPLELTNGTSMTPIEFNVLPVQTFYSMSQGLDSSDMIGTSVYSRYLQARLEFELPHGQSNTIQHPCNLYLIHGWVTAPLNRTLHTTPAEGDQERDALIEFIKSHVEEHFNQRRDKLTWKPKRTNTVKILGYRKIKPQTNFNLGIDSMMLNNPVGGGIQTYAVGSKPLINMVCNWPMKRKVHYVKGFNDTTLIPPAVENYYPNFSWLPFMLVYNPTAGDFFNTTLYPLGDPKVKVRYNCIHYYSDS